MAAWWKRNRTRAADAAALERDTVRAILVQAALPLVQELAEEYAALMGLAGPAREHGLGEMRRQFVAALERNLVENPPPFGPAAAEAYAPRYVQEARAALRLGIARARQQLAAQLGPVAATPSRN